MLRLSRKSDVEAHLRLITSIYLPEEEFSVLAASLSGIRINKLRHRLHSPLPGVLLTVDEFEAHLHGLVLAEAEFETDDLLAAFRFRISPCVRLQMICDLPVSP